jgi:hypothetical protein
MELSEKIQELKKQKQDRIEVKVKNIILDIEKYGSAKRETCPSNSYGWSMEEHNEMYDVAKKLRELGFNVKSKVNWEVFDWYINV